MFDAFGPEHQECEKCQGFGLKSERRKYDGINVIASVPCDCPAGDEYRKKRNNQEKAGE